MTYSARDNQVFALDELFLTVHETEPNRMGLITVREQAALVADVLNGTPHAE